MAGSVDITGRQNYVFGIGHPKTKSITEGSPAVWNSTNRALVDPSSGADVIMTSLRSPSYFSLLNNAYGGEMNAAVNTVTTIPAGSNHQFLQSIKVVRSASRFRLYFTNGMPGTANTAFTLAGKTQVPTKNGSGVIYIPWLFNGQSSYTFPAGGGVVIATDWMVWPVEAGDYMYAKGILSNGGAAFDMPNMSSPSSVAAGSAAGDWDSAITGTGADATAVAKGTGVWTNAAYIVNMFRTVMVETDCANKTDLPTTDFWGDSIGQGTDGNSNSWLNQMGISAGVPFQNYCIAGTNQTQIPIRARIRMALAKGDIAVSEHGRNATGNFTELRAFWAFLRGLGYKKIIQTTTTDWIGLASGTLGESSAAMRAYQVAQAALGATGGGPDVLWDIRPYIQQQVSSNLTVGTITVANGSAAVTGNGTNFTEALCGTLLTRTDGTTIGSVLTVESATALTLTANATAHTAQSFTAQQWKATQQGAAITITATKGSTAVTFGGTTGFAGIPTGAYLVATDGGVIGKVSNSTTLTANANRTYSGSVGILWSSDGLHLLALGDNSGAALMVSDGLPNALKSIG